MAAERSRAGHAMKRADKMPRDRVQPRALRELRLDIGHHRREHVLHRRMRRRLAEHFGVGRQQPPRLLIGRASQHDAIDMRKMRLCFRKARDAAVDDDGHAGHRGLQPIDPVVVERRDVAIFLRRQSIEPGLAGVDNKRVRAGGDHAARERIERDFRILVVDADPALDRDGNADRALHRGDAVGDQRRLRHQAGAEAAVLHPVRRTADIEVDLVIAEILADLRCDRELARIRAAELQRHRMFASRRSRAAAPGRHEGWRRSSASPCKAAHAASSGDGRRGNAGRSSPSWGRRKSGEPKRSYRQLQKPNFECRSRPVA